MAHCDLSGVTRSNTPSLRLSSSSRDKACWGVGRSKERDGATVIETGSDKPAWARELRARRTDWDLIRVLPSGPAAYDRTHLRPHTCPHPTCALYQT
jgi:hypothetical protein